MVINFYMTLGGLNMDFSKNSDLIFFFSYTFYNMSYYIYNIYI